MNLISIITILSILCSVAGHYRLPTNVKPSFYTIKIHPNLESETFKGHVSINFKVESFTDSILFHSTGLTIITLYLNTQRVYYKSDPLNSTLYFTYEDESIRIRRRDEAQIAAGSYFIRVKYFGSFSTDDNGFFKANYTSDDTVKSFIAVTDFEPFHARRTFPCFDEPAFKAQFQLTIVVPNSSYFALSNMRAIKTFKTTYGQVYKFETTPLMSTYLVAFAITQYQYLQKDCGGVPIRTYSYDKLSKNVTHYACESLKFISRYTGYCNVLPKLDFIEYDRPASTGTENWGLITLRSGVLRNDTDIFGDTQKVNIITHEIAHFWFGNLVTNEWWDDIWLQEGFAVFIALKAEEHILKNNATDNFGLHMLEDSIYPLDIKNKSRPIVNFAQTPSKIRENFSDITYLKGAALLLMVEMVLGERKMQEAISCYVNKYAFKSASTNDFLSVLEDNKPHNEDLRGFMESYLYQNTYPIIHVVEKDNEYVLRQNSSSAVDKNVESPFEYRWTIPLTYKTNKHKKNSSLIWFGKEVETLTISKENETWIKFNPEKNGLYRVNYSLNMWDKFVEHSKEMTSDDKGHLYIEAAQLFTIDVISCDVALNYFRRITEKNANQLPIEMNILISTYFKFRKIRRYDEKAHTCVRDYFVSVLKNSDYVKKGNIETSELEDYLSNLDGNEIDKKKNRHKPSQSMKMCITWIHETFSNYCNNY